MRLARLFVIYLIERMFSVFCSPETLHSDQGTEFYNQLANELQSVLG